MWSRVSDLLLAFWKREFGIDARFEYKHLFMCEIVEKKRSFLLEQFETECMFKDIVTLASQNTLDVISNTEKPMPHARKYTSGFSCKDFSKQNKNRKKGANLLKRGEGSSGQTYHGARNKQTNTAKTKKNNKQKRQPSRRVQVAPGHLHLRKCDGSMRR